MEIYLDNAATMPVSAKTAKSMQQFLTTDYGNPSSLHSLGFTARNAVFKARKSLAMEIGARTEEIIFTGSATEANALAILGAAADSKGKKKVIISSIEHSSVYENAMSLKEKGFQVVHIPVSEEDGIDMKRLEEEIDKDTAIVSIMHVNSETGIVNDIAKIGKICKNRNALFHVDAVQSFGKIRVQVKSLGIDLLTAGGHKIGGPKGIGFLYVREGAPIKPLFEGGGQEKGLRAGTENVPGIIGFANALVEYKTVNWNKVEKNRDLLQNELERLGARITAKELYRAPGHLHICFEGILGEEMLNYLSTREIYCSTGSACDSGKKEKRVLDSLKIEDKFQRGAIRFTLGGKETEKDMKKVTGEVKKFLNRFKNAQR